MKNKIIYSIAILAVAVLAAINMSVNTQDNALSDVSLSNIEALAYELDEVTVTCGQYNGQCWTLKMWGGCVFCGDPYTWCF